MSPRRLLAFALVLLAGCGRSPEHEFEAGVAEFKQGKFAKAETHFARAIAGAPPTAQALNFLGVCRLHEGNTEAAIHDFQEALKLDPSHAAARYNLAAALREAAPPPTPVKVAERPAAPKVEPVVVAPPVKVPEPVKVTAPPPEPVPTAKVEAPAPPPPPAPAPAPTPVIKRRTTVATHSLKAGNRAKAQAVFNEAINLQQQGKLSAAISGYAKAVATDPSFANAYYNLAIAYRDAGYPARALDNYELALLANPQFTNARINYAILLQQDGYVVDALAQYEQVLQETPNDSSVHLTVATLYARDRETKDKARQHYQAFLKLAPNSPLARDIRRWLDQNR